MVEIRLTTEHGVVLSAKVPLEDAEHAARRLIREAVERRPTDAMAQVEAWSKAREPRLCI